MFFLMVKFRVPPFKNFVKSLWVFRFLALTKKVTQQYRQLYYKPDCNEKPASECNECGLVMNGGTNEKKSICNCASKNNEHHLSVSLTPKNKAIFDLTDKAVKICQAEPIGIITDNGFTVKLNILNQNKYYQSYGFKFKTNWRQDCGRSCTC